jgi:endonuclease YncB( thermonuclease family)
MGRAAAIAAVIAMSLPAPAVGAGKALTDMVSVIDGDSVMVGETEVRLHGVDAPEAHERCFVSGRRVPCGAMATAELERLAGGRIVECEQVDTDRYGRVVAVCRLNGTDIGEAMVRSGWATAFIRYSKAYVPAEAEARAARRGLWGQ